MATLRTALALAAGLGADIEQEKVPAARRGGEPDQFGGFFIGPGDAGQRRIEHLLGFDHENERDARAMEKLEREILAEFGWPDPYQ